MSIVKYLAITYLNIVSFSFFLIKHIKHSLYYLYVSYMSIILLCFSFLFPVVFSMDVFNHTVFQFANSVVSSLLLQFFISDQIFYFLF